MNEIMERDFRLFDIKVQLENAETFHEARQLILQRDAVRRERLPAGKREVRYTVRFLQGKGAPYAPWNPNEDHADLWKKLNGTTGVAADVNQEVLDDLLFQFPEFQAVPLDRIRSHAHRSLAMLVLDIPEENSQVIISAWVERDGQPLRCHTDRLLRALMTRWERSS